MKTQKGALTVFLSIILTVTIFLSGTIVEGSRIRIAHTQIKRALENATNSLLAGYNTRLKDEYGLFALASEDPLVATEQVKFFANSSLNPQANLSSIDLFISYLQNNQEHFWDLQDYNIDSIETNLKHSLNSNAVLENQILEFIKYRAPVALYERFSMQDLQNEFQTISLMNNIMAEKLKIDRKFAEIGRQLFELDKQISRANQFSISKIETDSNSIISQARRYKSLLGDRDNIEERIENVRDRLRNLRGGEEYQGERDRLNEQLDNLRNDLDDVNYELGNYRNKVKDQIKEIENKLDEYIGINNSLVSMLTKLDSAVIQLEKDVDVFEESVNSFEAEGNASTEFIKMARLDIEKYKNSVDSQQIDARRTQASLNKDATFESLNCLGELEKKLNELRNAHQDNRSNIVNEIIANRKNLMNNVNIYEEIEEMEVATLEIGSDELAGIDDTDDRKGIISAIKSGMDEIFGSLQIIEIPEDAYKLLEAFDQSNKVFDPETLGFCEEASKGTAEEMQSFGKALVDITIGGRDKVYIIEYIMGTFKSAITAVDVNPDPQAEDFAFNNSLRGIPKTNRNSFFDYEIEYIIYGSKNQKNNATYAITAILGLRFVANMVYVYTNPKLVKGAAAKAKAIALLTGKFAVFTYPIVKALIMSAHAMRESVEDIKALKAGEQVPLIKKHAVEKKEIAGVSGKTQLSLTYEDYLYIFLMTKVSKDTKLDRISNLIQINMHEGNLSQNFAVQKFYTYAITNIEASIKNIFLNLVHIDEFEDRKIGRHNLDITIMDGY